MKTIALLATSNGIKFAPMMAASCGIIAATRTSPLNPSVQPQHYSTYQSIDNSSFRLNKYVGYNKHSTFTTLFSPSVPTTTFTNQKCWMGTSSTQKEGTVFTKGSSATDKLEEKVRIKREAKNAVNTENNDNIADQQAEENYMMPHPLWADYHVQGVEITHCTPKNFVDKLAFWTVKAIRFNFDWMSGYSFGKLTVNKCLTRIIFLETVAGVPGSVAAMLRHLGSLRKMQRDHGWIHTLLEEAENERMHLLTALTLKEPGLFFKLCVLMTQCIFYNFFFISYLIHSRFCHRLVGYIEEEAVRTYTHILDEIDSKDSDLNKWQTAPAPDIAIKYWHLSEDATLRDLMLVIRADEAHHREVNHTFADIAPNTPNPFGLGK